MEEIVNAATMTIAEIELRYHPTVRASDCPRITKSTHAYKLFIESWDNGRINLVEECRIMLLNSDKRLLGICTVPRSANVQSVTDPKLVFATALKAQATEIIVARNRVTGHKHPTPSDHDLAKTLVCGSLILGLTFSDYLIVNGEGFYSFAFEGVL